MSQVAFEIAIIFLLIVGLLAVAIAASLLRPARRAGKSAGDWSALTTPSRD